MTDLALTGGTPVRKHGFPLNITIGEEEIQAATDVLKSGLLSGFYGSPDDRFFGGNKVREFEKHLCEYFQTSYAVTVNSATSALHAALFAVGVGPGDEVIVTPYTMSATATAILMQRGIPVFSDIDANTFNLDPKKIAEKISPKTKAILVVNLFGNPAELDTLKKIAREHKIALIEDCAQAPGATFKNQFAGTIGDIGILSLNCHKAIQTGEGGVALTDNAEFALRMQLIRNHGEVVAGILPNTEQHDDVIGYNYRLTELQAAIGIEQLKKLDKFNEHRIALAHQLSENLFPLEGLQIPQVDAHAKHVYYLYPLKLLPHTLGVKRRDFCAAVQAEGIPLREGYVRPLYWSPIYKKGRIATLLSIQGSHSALPTYKLGTCPVTERLYEEELTTFHQLFNNIHSEDIKDVIRAIVKVHNRRASLKK